MANETSSSGEATSFIQLLFQILTVKYQFYISILFLKLSDTVPTSGGLQIDLFAIWRKRLGRVRPILTAMATTGNKGSGFRFISTFQESHNSFLDR